jgi:hypothetical protein
VIDAGISPKALVEWVRSAKAGTVLTYATINGSVCPRNEASPSYTPDTLLETVRRAQRLHLEGEVELVQRRVGEMPSPGRIGRFDYLAIKRRHVRPRRNVWAKADWPHLQYSRPTSEPECVPA